VFGADPVPAVAAHEQSLCRSDWGTAQCDIPEGSAAVYLDHTGLRHGATYRDETRPTFFRDTSSQISVGAVPGDEGHMGEGFRVVYQCRALPNA
jgi:hypothetical protein